MTVLHIIGSVLVVLGALMFAVAALGLIRFPDAYTRISSVGTAAGVGIGLLLLGVAFTQFDALTMIKAVIAVVVQLITSAIGSLSIGRSAYLTGVTMQRWSYDELDPDEATSAPGSGPHSQV